MAVCFTSNRSIGLSLDVNMTAFDLQESARIFVSAASSGTLSIKNDLFEFEMDNPVDHEPFNQIFISSVYNILITSTRDRVQVWDIFRSVEGVRLGPVQNVPLPSKPTSMFMVNGNLCYIGLSNGKVHSLDLDECAKLIPTPRYSSKSLCDLGACVTAISGFGNSHIMIGTSEGVVKVMKLESKKLACTIKPPQSDSSVEAICPILHVDNDAVPFAVCYSSTLVCLVFNGAIVHVCKNIPEPVKSLFTASAMSPDSSPLIALLASGRLIRLDGPKWTHLTELGGGNHVLALKGESAKQFMIIEKTNEGITQIKRYEVTTGLGPLKPLEPLSIGSLSLSAIGRQPIRSIGLPRNDRSLEPNLIRLCNSLTNYTQSSTERFVFDYNAGLWEGVIASVVNGPSELLLSIYTQTTVRVLGRVPILTPHLAIVSSFAIDCLGQDRWSLLLGFSNGQVGVMESTIDYPSPGLKWKDIWFLDAPEQVHVGARITRVDRSLFGSNLVTSVDSNGMVCFTRIDESPDSESFSKSLNPAHVAIAGEGGCAFPDSAHNCSYIAVSGGGIERVKVPRLRKDGSEDMHDADVWSATTVVDSLSLDGTVVRLFPADNYAVYSDGIAVISFSAKSNGKILHVSRLPEEYGSSIRDAETFTMNGKTYLVVLTESHALAYDSHGSRIFHRTIEGSKSNPCWLLAGSVHMFKWAESITSLAFADRTKVLSAPELVIAAAQKHFKFPPIHSTPFTETLARVDDKAETFSETSSTASKKGFFKRAFGSKTKEERARELDETKFKPTQDHLVEARMQLQKNLDAMAKLQNNSEEMENASADFLRMAKQLNYDFSQKEKKKKGKFFGLFD